MLERRWHTQNLWFRFFNYVVGTTVVAVYLVYHLSDGRYARSSESIVEFSDKLAGEMFVIGM